MSFFPTAAAAGEAGFRPCLRCRPECAPGTPAWSGTSTTVRRGLRLIAGGALDDGNVEHLAARLGVTSRHLRRLFTRHIGASPLAVAHTQRLQFAKRLIDQTALAMQDIAIASGYGSVRRFNDAFRNAYGRTPRELRRAGRETQEVVGDRLTVKLAYRKPLNWENLTGFFGARAIPGVEAVVDRHYLRTITIGGATGIIDLEHDPKSHNILLTLHRVPTAVLFPIVQRIREMFDLDAPVKDIVEVLAQDTVLANRLLELPGVRVPGAWDGFELMVRAILGQQISVKAATTLAGRLAARYGTPLDSAFLNDSGEPLLSYSFPDPERLMQARLDKIGIVGSRAETIRNASRAVTEETLSFDPAQDPQEFRKSVMSIRGIGDWTAQYIAMRVLKHPDAFPSSDLGLLRAYGDGRDERIRPAELARISESWRPWRAYAALLLWSTPRGSGG